MIAAFFALPFDVQFRIIAATVLTDVLEVFTEVGTWITTFLPTLYGLFWTEGSGLTLLGILCIAALAFAVCFLFIGLIQRFMRFRA